MDVHAFLYIQTGWILPVTETQQSPYQGTWNCWEQKHSPALTFPLNTQPKLLLPFIHSLHNPSFSRTMISFSSYCLGGSLTAQAFWAQHLCKGTAKAASENKQKKKKWKLMKTLLFPSSSQGCRQREPRSSPPLTRIMRHILWLVWRKLTEATWREKEWFTTGFSPQISPFVNWTFIVFFCIPSQVRETMGD